MAATVPAISSPGVGGAPGGGRDSAFSLHDIGAIDAGGRNLDEELGMFGPGHGDTRRPENFRSARGSDLNRLHLAWHFQRHRAQC